MSLCHHRVRCFAAMGLWILLGAADVSGQTADESPPPAPTASAPVPRSAGVVGPLSEAPAGQLAIIHVPDAARVLRNINRLLETIHEDASLNPLWRHVDSLALAQPLGDESSVTLCIGPRTASGRYPQVTLVTRVDTAAALRGGVLDAAGYVHRSDKPDAMALPGDTIAVGDGEALPQVARAVRGVRLTPAEIQTLADADILVRLDAHLLLAGFDFQKWHDEQAARVAEARQSGAPEATVARLEQRVRAGERLYANLQDISAVTVGLLVDARAVDIRVCLSVERESRLGGLLVGHPPLAGELNPPLPKQPFAALGYASFDGQRMAGLMQWLLDLAVDAVIIEAGGRSVGPTVGKAEVDDLHALFDDLRGVLGDRLGFLIPLRPAAEPVLQLDAVVALKDAASGPAWRGLLPTKLDALAYLARVAFGGAGPKVQTMLEPAAPDVAAPIDRWRLMLEFPEAPSRDESMPEVSAEERLSRAVLGADGLSLWSAAVRAWGYASIAPDSTRVAPMVVRNMKGGLDQAGDDPLTTEALRHMLRRSNVFVLWSPGTLSQLIGRTILTGMGGYGRAHERIPLVDPEALAALSVRLAEGDISARLYVPVSELSTAVSLYRTLQKVDEARPLPKLPEP